MPEIAGAKLHWPSRTSKSVAKAHELRLNDRGGPAGRGAMIQLVAAWVAFALLAAFFAALVAVLGKVGVKNVDTTLATAVRAVVMMVVLVIAAAVLGKARQLSTIDGRSLLFIFLSGLAGAASWLFYFVALKHGPAAGVAALDRLSVALVFVLAIAFLGDPFSWKGAAGAALVVAGAVLLT
jgi:bacterial/archaeal transporter family protein